MEHSNNSNIVIVRRQRFGFLPCARIRTQVQVRNKAYFFCGHFYDILFDKKLSCLNRVYAIFYLPTEIKLSNNLMAPTLPAGNWRKKASEV